MTKLKRPDNEVGHYQGNRGNGTQDRREREERIMGIRTDLEKDWKEYNGKSPRWDAVVQLMDDYTREMVHGELAPCTEKDFFDRYSELDPELGEVTQW